MPEAIWTISDWLLSPTLLFFSLSPDGKSLAEGVSDIVS